MSLDLNSLLNNYLVETSPLRQFFWRKERQAGGTSYPIPIKEQYVDFLKVILGLHIIERERLDYVKELKITTSYPYNFFSIVSKLESLFFLLSNLKMKLRVVPKSSRCIWKKLDEDFPYQKVVLFSSGLDSLCGALELSEDYKVVLAHCITNQVIFSKILKLANMPHLQRSILYCCNARTKETTGGISETRGLLFLSFAYAIAASLDLKSIVFCENGSQMLDVMLGPLVYPNKPATKNTNLMYIEKIEDIFSSFNNSEFKIEYPYKDMTKAEMLNSFKDRIRFEDTFSCFSTRYRTAMCGICWNCFIRRVSMLAIDVEEEYNTYETNPFEFVYEMSQKESYKNEMNILYHLLRFYYKIATMDSSAQDEVRISTRDYFGNSISLVTRFAKDIFLGVMKLLQTTDEARLNPLGKKAKELLDQIDERTLMERKEELMKRVRTATSKES